MDRISARQPLVPGLVDLTDDELSPRKSGIDAWTIFAAFVVTLGLALLVWGTTI